MLAGQVVFLISSEAGQCLLEAFQSNLSWSPWYSDRAS